MKWKQYIFRMKSGFDLTQKNHELQSWIRFTDNRMTAIATISFMMWMGKYYQRRQNLDKSQSSHTRVVLTVSYYIYLRGVLWQTINIFKLRVALSKFDLYLSFMEAFYKSLHVVVRFIRPGLKPWFIRNNMCLFIDSEISKINQIW